MQAEIITIGDELLIGMTVDTNSAWIGQELTGLGFSIYQVTTVRDNSEHITSAIEGAMGRSDLVIVTGGLGPTSDDITKGTIAEYFDTPLVLHNDTLSAVQKMLDARGLEMNDNNYRQAMLPEACTVLSNERGTAPGMLFNDNGKILVSMPGVPYEMKYIVNTHLVPYLINNFNKTAVKYRVAMTYGSFEAKLAEILEPFEQQLPPNISIAYLPTSGIIKIRLTAKGRAGDNLDAELVKQLDVLKGYIPDLVYGYDGELLEECTGRLLKDKNLSLAVAESCTGGNLSRMITTVPGCSAYFTGSVVSYHNNIKINELGVQAEIINEKGAVSREVALSMAEGIMKRFKTDYGIGVTGIAGPDGGSTEKPVGTVWIAVASKSKNTAECFSFGRDRKGNIRRASLAALNMLRKAILSDNL